MAGRTCSLVLASLLLVAPALCQTAGAATANPATGAAGNGTKIAESPVCMTARQAQMLTLNVGALARNATPPFAENAAVLPSRELVVQVANTSMQQARNNSGETNGVTFFQPGTPYDLWGDGLMQFGLSQAVHVPSATLGEMSYVAASINERWIAELAAAKAKNPNATLPPQRELEIWTDAWDKAARTLQEDAEDMDDELSRRAMLLRSINYLNLGWYAQPSNKSHDEAYKQATKTFREAMETFDAYQTTFFKVPFDNGTAQGELDAFLVTPNPNTQSPLLIFLNSPVHWKEVHFMRYGLAALRRGYAVMFMEQPGQGMALIEPPHLPGIPVRNASLVAEAALDAVEGSPELEKVVEPSKVVLVGIGTVDYDVGRMCATLSPERIAGCILNPGIFSWSDVISTRLGKSLYAPLTQVAITNPDAFGGNDALVEAFQDPTNSILKPLLFNCTALDTSYALLTPLMMTAATPEAQYTPRVVWGMWNATRNETLAAYWPAMRRIIANLTRFDVSDWGGHVLIMGGSEDRTAGGQEAELAEALERGSPADVTLVNFGPETGAALSTQIGSVTYWEQEAFPWLDKALGRAGGDGGSNDGKDGGSKNNDGGDGEGADGADAAVSSESKDKEGK